MPHTYPSTVRTIDDLLLRLRQAQARPSYQRRILAGADAIGSMATLRVLRSIEKAGSAGRSPSIGDVAAALEVEHSTASRAVNEAVRRGLVERSPCADDQRRVSLRLSEAGATAARGATEARRELLASAIAGWADDDIDRLGELMVRLVDGLERAGSSAPGADANR